MVCRNESWPAPAAFPHTMQASAPPTPSSTATPSACNATTFSVAYGNDATASVRNYAAFVITRTADGPILPESAEEIATTNALVFPPVNRRAEGLDAVVRVAMNPRHFKRPTVSGHAKADPRLTSNDALYFWAEDMDRDWGPNVHAKVAWHCTYKRRRINTVTRHGAPPIDIDVNFAESSKETSIVVLAALPSPHAGYDGSITFRPPAGLSIQLHAMHGDRQSFMRAWTAIPGSDELIVVDPALIDRLAPPTPVFRACSGCRDAVSAWSSATRFAERAVSLCGACYVEYKRRETNGENARPPPCERVSPFMFARERSDVPLNAEKAVLDVLASVAGDGTIHRSFSFH